MIIETAIYDGRLKEHRVLNLSTGSVYSMWFDSEDDALASIEDGEERVGHKVKRIKLSDIELACYRALNRGEISA